MASELVDSRLLVKARQLCSKKKQRFQENGFDLDLSYITPRIIAMGFPSTGWEATFRNPLRQVQRFFQERHGDRYKVYNLCSERDYDLRGTFPLSERFPFDDHNVCPMEMLTVLVDSIAGYLQGDERRIVAVHCKAGKGRTGMVISALLLRLGLCRTASEALLMFAERRTHNCKGVTIPSQRRYVKYYEQLLQTAVSIPGDSALSSMSVPRTEFELVGVRLTSVPVVDSTFGHTRCKPYFKVLVNEPPPGDDVHQPWAARQTFCYREALSTSGDDLKSFESSQRLVDLDLSRYHVKLSGEILIKFFAAHTVGKSERMFQVWFNTAFVRCGNRVVQFNRNRIDGVHKDKNFKNYSSDFALLLFLKSTASAQGCGHPLCKETGSADAVPMERSRSPTSPLAPFREVSASATMSAGSDSDERDDEMEYDAKVHHRPSDRRQTHHSVTGKQDELEDEGVEIPHASTMPGYKFAGILEKEVAAHSKVHESHGDESSVEDLSHESDHHELDQSPSRPEGR